MCYGGEYAYSEVSGDLHWISHRDIRRLEEDGRVQGDGVFYPRHIIPLSLFEDGAYRAVPARFDLIPRDFRSRDRDLTLDELIRLKNSRRKDPATGRAMGYSSWNARVESVRELFSFRAPWNQGRRAVLPVRAFLERPNEDYTPPEVMGKEFRLTPDARAWMGCIWDKVERKGEALHSFAIVTMDSEGHRVKREIFHGRLPTLLTDAEAEEWMDPRTPPDRAFALVKPFPGERLRIEEVPRPPKPPEEGEQIRLI